jgi:hypothetical protein
MKNYVLTLTVCISLISSFCKKKEEPTPTPDPIPISQTPPEQLTPAAVFMSEYFNSGTQYQYTNHCWFFDNNFTKIYNGTVTLNGEPALFDPTTGGASIEYKNVYRKSLSSLSNSLVTAGINIDWNIFSDKKFPYLIDTVISYNTFPPASNILNDTSEIIFHKKPFVFNFSASQCDSIVCKIAAGNSVVIKIVPVNTNSVTFSDQDINFPTYIGANVLLTAEPRTVKLWNVRGRRWTSITTRVSVGKWLHYRQ